MTPLTKIRTSIIVVIVLLIIQLSIEGAFACETGLHLEAGAGKNGNWTGSSIPWDDGGGVGFYGSIRYEWEYAVCHGSHFSQYDVGPPSNDRSESSLDHLGCAFRIKLL